MRIEKNNIRTCEKYLAPIEKNKKIILGVKISELSNLDKLTKIGFSKNLEIGEKILPKYLGPKTKFNGEGKSIPIKTLPKETFYMFREWSWTDYTGKDYCKIVSIPRERYQRQIIPPPGIELNIGSDINGIKYIYIDPIIYTDKNYSYIVNGVNILLELFGFCNIYIDEFKPVIVPTKKLNWTTLPPGKKTWEELEKNILNPIKKSKKVIFENRINILKSFLPSFIAIGHGGFSGYIVFGYEDKNIFILENLWYGNATYIFNENWETMSKLTKTEVLFNNLFKERIIHSPTWLKQIEQNFK